jgi:NitT/TauT family transport system permease protein
MILSLKQNNIGDDFTQKVWRHIGMRSFHTKKTVQSWLWLFVLIILWEFATRLGLINTYLLPPFSKVAVNLAHELFAGKLGIQVLNSLWVILQGFGLSFFLAVVITLLCAWLPPVESLFNTLSTIMNPLPSVAILPLIIMWFGISTSAMLIIIIHGVLWALVRHLLDGLRAVPEVYREWGRNIGLGPWSIFSGILVFAIMPEFLAGLRVSWGRAWRALLSAEMIFGMIGTLGGLGYYIYTNRAYANLTNVMSGVVVIVIIGILVETLLFGQFEKYTIRKWGMTHD